MSKDRYRVKDFLVDFDWAANDFYQNRGRGFEKFLHGASAHFHGHLIEKGRSAIAPPAFRRSGTQLAPVAPHVQWADSVATWLWLALAVVLIAIAYGPTLVRLAATTPLITPGVRVW